MYIDTICTSSVSMYTDIHTPSISCITHKDLLLPSLDDAILPVSASNFFHTDAQLIPKPTELSIEQQAKLDAVIGTFADVFYSNDDNIFKNGLNKEFVSLHILLIRLLPSLWSCPSMKEPQKSSCRFLTDDK
ncbi:hypothetical protein AVEN_64052-1 [Araneus ventricosus]|uniref:Uncharacterized protein n=1 Tax=Araneus ventricosus TaxID=182803 RepID=A0A4Y2IX29_ARAVE|nr:hypothetical protein AVEN_64052-1 [Araneus ventricosus]